MRKDVARVLTILRDREIAEAEGWRWRAARPPAAAGAAREDGRVEAEDGAGAPPPRPQEAEKTADEDDPTTGWTRTIGRGGR